MKYALVCLAGIAVLSQTLPLEVRRGEREGTVVIAVPGASLPLVQEGADWVGQLEMTYQVIGAGGQVLDKAADGGTELRVAMTVRPAGTQFAGSMPLSEATFQVDTSVALVPFQVEKSSGSFVSDLRADEIRVLEDGVAREAELLAVGRMGPAAVPADITLLHDRSGSMAVNGAYNAEVFRKGLLEEFPNVRIAIYGFSDELVRFTPHTRDVDALNRASGMVAAIARFDLGRTAVRIMIVLSDGQATRFDSETDAGEGSSAATPGGEQEKGRARAASR